MPNHIHLVWQIQDGYKRENIQMHFLKFTAQQMKFRLMDTNDSRLDDFSVKVSDRQYQFWERKAQSVDLWSWPLFVQKLDYTHNNPVKDRWKLAASPEDYKYSSAKFYVKGIDGFGLLTHYASRDW